MKHELHEDQGATLQHDNTIQSSRLEGGVVPGDSTPVNIVEPEGSEIRIASKVFRRCTHVVISMTGLMNKPERAKDTKGQIERNGGRILINPQTGVIR